MEGPLLVHPLGGVGIFSGDSASFLESLVDGLMPVLVEGEGETHKAEVEGATGISGLQARPEGIQEVSVGQMRSGTRSGT